VLASWQRRAIMASAPTVGTYSEIVWLGAGWTAPTRPTVNRITALANGYSGGPEHACLLGALADHGLAAGFNDAGADTGRAGGTTCNACRARYSRSSPYFSACCINGFRRKRSPHRHQRASCEEQSPHSVAERRTFAVLTPHRGSTVRLCATGCFMHRRLRGECPHLQR
jgi:hypothetical protein